MVDDDGGGFVYLTSCPKKPYEDQVGALLALATMDREDKPRKRECRAYQCRRCPAWHLTSQSE